MASQPAVIPLKEYFALHSYVSSLLCASFVFLPHSSSWLLGNLPAVQRSSADRPEHPFLTPLTSRPALSMCWSIFGMVLCMAWWGHRLKGWSSGVDLKRSVVDEREVDERQNRMSRNLRHYGQTLLSCLAAAVLIGLFALLMGAPLDSFYTRTLLLSLHVSVLLVWPVVFTLGLPSLYDSGLHARYRMTRLLCDFRPESTLERALVYPVIGVLAGTWIGAAPIPLDWDRPWQSYPLTPAVGAVLGWVIGGYVSWFQSAMEETVDNEQKEAPVKSKTKKRRVKQL